MAIRRTVALLVPELTSDYFDGVVTGARMAAEEKRINLLIIVGGIYGVDEAKNVLYQLADQKSIDAIITPSSAVVKDSEDFAPFMQLTAGKPQLTLSDKHEGIPCIYYDNTTGIKEAMEYLINNKGCARILMFAGPEYSGDAEERLSTYMESMKAAGLHVEDRMIARGNHRLSCIEEARKLIEDNPGADAVICSNDWQAQALYRVLKEKDIKVGRDIYVTGYDDISESSYLDPPLASVSTSHIALGYEAITLAARMADGEKAEDKILKCHFINRESAGYDPYFQLLNFEKRKNFRTGMFFDIPSLASAMVDFIFTGDAHEYQAGCQRKLLEDFFLRLLETHLGDVVRRRSMHVNDHSFGNIFGPGGTDNIDCDRLFRVLDSIYRVYCAREMSEISRMELSNLIARIKSTVAESLERKSGDMRKVVGSKYASLAKFSERLVAIEPDDPERFGKLMEALPCIGVISASIFMYDRAKKQKKGEKFDLPDKLYLKAFRDRTGVHIVDEIHQATDTADVMDYRYLEGGVNHSFFAMPLHYGGYQLGIMLIDLDNEYNISFALINNEINLVVSHWTGETLRQD